METSPANFWRDLRQCAEDSLRFDALSGKTGAETKVPQFDLALCRQQEVFGLEIPVHYAMGVQVVESLGILEVDVKDLGS